MQLQAIYRKAGQAQYPIAIRGTIRQFAKQLYDELLTSGYSLMLEDVESLSLQGVQLLAGWTRLDCQFVDDCQAKNVPTFFNLNLDVGLLADEWVIVLPVIRSHCDLVQSRRMEGSQALGVQGFGIGSSEALQHYQQAIDVMKKEAFCHEPFTVDFDELPSC